MSALISSHRSHQVPPNRVQLQLLAAICSGSHHFAVGLRESHAFQASKSGAIKPVKPRQTAKPVTHSCSQLQPVAANCSKRSRVHFRPSRPARRGESRRENSPNKNSRIEPTNPCVSFHLPLLHTLVERLPRSTWRRSGRGGAFLDGDGGFMWRGPIHRCGQLQPIAAVAASCSQLQRIASGSTSAFSLEFVPSCTICP